MAIYKNTPPIVTDGLVLYLDAANRISYVSGSTIWNDLSGLNNNGTLVDGPTFSSADGGSIVFDGVNDYVAGTITPLSGSAFTICTWIKPLVSLNTNTYFSIGSSPATDQSIHLRFLSNTIFRFALYADDLDVNITSAPGNWNYIVCTLDISKLQSVYQNSIFKGSRTSAGMFIGNNSYAVGAWGLSPVIQYINANIGLVQVYNRAFSQQEITQNYNATKTRFNLS
jgi:hypothetical protein